MPHWYDATPTIMHAGGITTYVNCTPVHLPKGAAAKQWLDRAQAKGAWPVIVTRKAVAVALKDVGATAITAAKLRAETTDVAAPATGTKEEKEKAVAEKLATIVPVSEWEKIEALAAEVVADEESLPIGKVVMKRG